MTTMRCSIAISTSLALVLALPLTGQETAGQPTFSDTTTTLIVEVPVEVTHNGQPLRGLKPENFEVIDDGKVQTITGFEMVDLTLPPRSASSQASALQRRAPQTTQLPVIARRHFLLLFDLSFAAPSALERARTSAQQLVDERLHPADLVAVAVHTLSRGVQLILGFTSDRDHLGVALKSLGLPQLAERRPDPLGLMFGALRDRPDQAPVDSRNNSAIADKVGSGFAEHVRAISEAYNRSDAADARRQVTAWARSFAELAEMLRAVQGRKHVVYFSEGFDSSILFANQDKIRQDELNLAANFGEVWRVSSEERFGSTQTTNVLDAMVQEFRRADCTVHSVDIGGLRAEADVANRPQGKDGLFMLASGTGGDFYENFNRLGDAMESLMAKTSVTYLLAFQPQDLPADGKYRKLKVRLKEVPKGAQIVHRPGYFAPGEQEASEQSTVREQAHRLAVAQQLLDSREGGGVRTSALAVPLRAPFLAEGKAYVPLWIEVDGPSLLRGAAYQTNRQPVRAEVYAYAINAAGSVGDFMTQTLSLDLERVGEPLRARGFKLMLPLLLEPGDYTVRVLVRNPGTGASGLRIAAVSVPANDRSEGGIALLPPLFPEPNDSWLLLRGSRDEVPADAPYPFLYGDQSFVPAAHAQVTADQIVPLLVLGYDLGRRGVQLSAQVVDALGQPVTEAPVILNSEPAPSSDGIDRFLAAFRVPLLPPGDYGLRIVWSDPGRDRDATSSAAFQVVAANAPTTQLLALSLPSTAFEQLPANPPPVAPERTAVLPVEALVDGYRQALRKIPEESRHELLQTIARLEVEALAGDPERRLARLTRSELKVALELARRDLETVVPILMLHHDLYLEHKRERRAYLMHHSVRMVRELADLYAKEGASQGSKIVAARALASIGGHLQDNGQSASLELFARATELDPSNVSALLGLAAYYEKRGGPYDKAVDHLRQLIAAHPEHREGRLRLAVNLFRLGREDEARTLLTQLAAEGPADWIFSLAAQELARDHARQQRLAEAIAILEKALEERPQDQKLFIQLTYLYDRNHEPYKADQLAERLNRALKAGEVVRGLYNEWPLQALEADRKELHRGAETRLPLVSEALGPETVSRPEGE